MSSPPPAIVDATTSAKRTATPLHRGNAQTSIETRTDLSTLYRLLRLCIRPLRPHLVGIKPLDIAGSPRLTSRPSSHYGVTVSERLLQIPTTAAYPLTQADSATNTQKLWLYDLLPKSLPETKAKGEADSTDPWWTHTIYYFAGGGFQAPASAEHWKLTARLAKDLSPRRIRVVMLSYPLAPKSPAKDSLPLLRAWLAQTLTEATPTETVSLMGDSAGANVVLSLAFWWSTALSRMTEQKQIDPWKKLVEILVISPPCDFRNTNPAIEEADKLDPVLTREVTGGAADAWCAGWTESTLPINHPLPASSASEPLDPATLHHLSSPDGGKSMDGKSDPALSMNLQPASAFTALRESGLIVHGMIGTADRLAPDAMVFMGLCVERGIGGSWLVWEGQMHCFALTVCYGVFEGKEGYAWVKRRVEEVIGGK